MARNRLAANSWLRPYVETYSLSHGNSVNKLFHYLGIPLLTTAAFGIAAHLPMNRQHWPDWLPANLATVLFAGWALWYVIMDWQVGLPTAFLLANCYVLGCVLTWPWLVGLIGVGVVSHIIGHYGFEGRPPSLLTNPRAVIEAPAWLACVWMGWFE